MKHMVHRYLVLWRAFFRNSLSRDMEFKMNFIFDLFIDAIFYGSYLFFFGVIFSYVDALGDFNRDAVIIFLLVTYLTDTVYVFVLGGNVFNINRMVIRGDLDLILVKPMNPQFFMSFRYVHAYALVSLGILLFFLVKMVVAYHGQFHAANFIFFFASFIMGISIIYSFEFIIACLVFWFRNFSVAGWLCNEVIKYSRRPDSIYRGWFRTLVFSFLPMAMISSLPARMLIFGPDIKILLFQAIVSGLFLWITTVVWKRGLLRYESASS